MKLLNKILLKSLYVIFPLLFFGVVHFTFAYGQNSFNIGEWSSAGRITSSFLGFVFMFFGVIVAYNINNKK